MTIETSRPFCGSDAVHAGELTWGVLNGPRFRRVEGDTYVAADVADSPSLRVRAALRRGGPTAVATGWSAVVAMGLDALPGPRPTEIAVADRRLRPVTDTVARRVRLTADEIETTDGIRHTTALRTAYDLARRSGPDRSAFDRVIDPLTDAVAVADALARHGRFTGDALLAFAGERPGGRGMLRLPAVAALLDPGADSPPESRLRVKVVLAGLPRPVTQFEVPDVFGGPTRWLDLAWPEFGVALEYDGHDHALSDRRGRDIDRIESLRRDGWWVLVVTARQAARPRWVPDRLREALVSRGWVPGPDAGREWAHIVIENAERS